jgi:hypothetical protein
MTENTGGGGGVGRCHTGKIMKRGREGGKMKDKAVYRHGMETPMPKLHWPIFHRIFHPFSIISPTLTRGAAALQAVSHGGAGQRCQRCDCHPAVSHYKHSLLMHRNRNFNNLSQQAYQKT